MDPETVLVINVKAQHKANMAFRVKSTTRMTKVMEEYCRRMGFEEAITRFLFHGERVAKQNTPNSLGIEDGDLIEAIQEQFGG